MFRGETWQPSRNVGREADIEPCGVDGNGPVDEPRREEARGIGSGSFRGLRAHPRAGADPVS